MFREEFTGAGVDILIFESFGSLLMLGNDEGGSSVPFIFNRRISSPQTLLRERESDVSSVGFKLEHLSIFLVEFSINVRVGSIIVDLADINHVIVVDKVFPKDKENSVVLFRKAHLLTVGCRDTSPEFAI